MEGFLCPRLGVWSAGSFQLSASRDGLSFREFPQGYTLPYPMTEGGRGYKVTAIWVQHGIILTGQPSSEPPVCVAESSLGLMAAYFLLLPSPASLPQTLIPKVLPPSKSCIPNPVSESASLKANCNTPSRLPQVSPWLT